jgi:hypothetical protein
VEDERKAVAIGEGAEEGGPMPPRPKARPKKRPDMVPTLPGKSSCSSPSFGGHQQVAKRRSYGARTRNLRVTGPTLPTWAVVFRACDRAVLRRESKA